MKAYLALAAGLWIGSCALAQETGKPKTGTQNKKPAKKFEQELFTKKADDLFQFKNYTGALAEYLALLTQNPTNERLGMQIGRCYLNLNEDRSKALPFLQPALENPKNNRLIEYYYAKALTYANQYSDAVDWFRKALAITDLTAEEKNVIERDLEMASSGKELVKFPLKVTFENLGKNINTPFADFSPYISFDEGFLIFNSRQESDGVRMANGNYTSDVYISEVYLGDWQQARNLGEVVNTKAGDESVVGVSADGLTMVYNINPSATEGQGQIFVGPKYENQILKPVKLNSFINAPSRQNSATISPDGKTLYFSSDRPGGFGGFDLYRSLILPDGEWSEAQNMGPEINTPYDEDFPNLSMDGLTLYFSSKGHNSMGGFDVFRTLLDEEKGAWTVPQNVGYPINNAYDNIDLCMSGKGRYGYMARIQSDGFGDLDVYRITFQEIEPEVTVVKGSVLGPNGNRAEGASITIKNLKNNQLVGEYLPNPKTGKYVAILSPGAYEISVSATGCAPMRDRLDVLGKSSFVPFISKDLTLPSR